MVENKGRIEAVIFDVDGLLVDSEPLWTRAQLDIFSGYGFDFSAADSQKTAGIRIDQIVAHGYEQRGWHGPALEQVIQDVVERMILLINECGAPLPGAREAVQFFRERSLPTAIASSSDCSIIEANITALDLVGCFDVISSAEHERYGKPHPAVYISTADQLGVDRHKCLVFEDSIAGVLAAKAAEMTCIAVPDETLKGDKRLGIADLVLESLAEFDEETWREVNS